CTRTSPKAGSLPGCCRRSWRHCPSPASGSAGVWATFPPRSTWEGNHMQCQKCRYEPTMAEMQASPEGCPKCGTSYKEEKVNRSAQKSISDKTAQKIAVLALLLLVAFGAGAGWIKYQ